jgi:hypothetical protein
MRRVIAAVTIAAMGAGAVWAGAGLAGHSPSGARHSDNMRLVANWSEGGTYRNGTDMAFWGDLLVLGNLDQGTVPGTASPPGGFRLMDVSDPASPRLVGKEVCSGDQSDVSIWEDLVITSVDKPTLSHCDTGEANWEGLRVHSIANREDPQLLTAVRTDCGSHTHTIYPDPANDRLLVYVLSYPLAGRYNPAGALATCNAASHRKISVVEVPLSNPAGARVLGKPSTGQTIGCHDVTVFVTPDPAEPDLAGAACLTESQIWSLEDPENPRILSSIRDPRVNIHHSTVFSNDGRTLVVGDELGGAAASPGCLTDRDTYGGLFFYDVSNPSSPQARGAHKLPQQVASLFCTAHLFNVVPLRDDRDVLVSSWYTGATSVIDFTDPAKPTQIAYYIPREPVTPDEQRREAAAWASYWYRGNVFSNNFDEDVNSVSPRSRGLDVFTVEHPLLAGAVDLPRLNPQLQEPLPAPPGEGGGPPGSVPPPSAGTKPSDAVRRARGRPPR